MGSGAYYRLGHGNDSDRHASVVSLLQGVSIISCDAGPWHVVVRAENSDIYVWGWNRFGQIGSTGGREEIIMNPKRLSEFDFLDDEGDYITRVVAGTSLCSHVFYSFKRSNAITLLQVTGTLVFLLR